MEILIYLMVILGVIYFMSGSEEVGNCLGGLIIFAICIAIVVFAFSINPLLGTVVAYLFLKGKK